MKQSRASDNGVRGAKKFAHFSHIWGKPGMSPHERYEMKWREIELCDALGFEYAFCVEHHFRPDEGWMLVPSLFVVGAGARTKNIGVGAMGYIVPLYEPIRLAEEIAIADQMVGRRLEVGLLPGIIASYFAPFGRDYEGRKPVTFEFVDFLRAAYGDDQPFTFHGDYHHAEAALMAVPPPQKPSPPIWMQSRDLETLAYCAREDFNTGFFIVYPRDKAAVRYRNYIDDWAAAGWDRKPDIGYSTIVYVDETDEKALEIASFRTSRAYEGFLAPAKPDETFDERAAENSKRFTVRGEGGAAEIMANLFDAAYLLDNDLVFIGSPETVTEKIHNAAAKGLFNTFMGEFNFSDLAEEDAMRSIRLFGEQVMPALHDFEPY